MSVRRALISLFMLIVVVLAALALGYRLRAQNQAAAAVDAETTRVQRGDITATIAANGAVAAKEVGNLSFLTAGQVTEIFVREGDRIDAGAPLLRLDSREQFLVFNQANLNYELALRQLEQTETIDENAIALAEANLRAAQSAYSGAANAVTPEQIAAAELQVQQAQTAYDSALAARQQADPGRQAPEAIQLLEAAVGEASFNLEIARLRLAEMGSANNGALGIAGARIQLAQQELDQLLAGANPYDVQQAQLAVDQAALTLDQARVQYERTVLTAPFAGVVSALNVEVGQRVNAGAPIVQIVNMTPLIVRAEIDETDLRFVTVGMEAQIVLEALPGVSFEGRVTIIDPAGREETGIVVYDIEVELASPDARIRPGMSATAQLITETHPNVLMIPERFLQTDPDTGQRFVNVLGADNRQQRRAVDIGLRGGEMVEITDGLQVNEVVTAAR